MSRALLLILVLAVCTAEAAFAQDEPLKGLAPPKEAGKGFTGMADGRLGFGFLGEDGFISLNIGTALQFGKLGVGVQVPLRFRVIDGDPKDDGVIRKEDWDEVSDWTRVLRYVEWNDTWLYARLGVLSGTSLGHGTIVDRYYNVIDADHYQTGVNVRLDLDVAGGEVMLDNLIDPNILGLRGFIRPFQLFSAPDITKKIAFGVSLVSDFKAPKDPRTTSDKQPVRLINDDGELEATTSNVFLLGFDLEWQVLTTSVVAMTPYMDLNILGQTGGVGYHLGLLTTFKLGSSVTLGTRAEYRALNQDYSPSWVNSWYEVERVDYLPEPFPDKDHGDVPLTKVGYFKRMDETGHDSVKHGFHVSADLNLFDTFTISALYEDYQGADNGNLMVRLLMPWISGFKFDMYFAKRNFDNPFEDFFDKAMAVASFKYRFWGPVFAYAIYSREWRLRGEEETDTTLRGTYETINDFDAGVGAEFSF